MRVESFSAGQPGDHEVELVNDGIAGSELVVVSIII